MKHFFFILTLVVSSCGTKTSESTEESNFNSDTPTVTTDFEEEEFNEFFETFKKDSLFQITRIEFPFTEKYLEFVITDKRTNINIPFKNMANRLIAKTIMRKPTFKSPDPVLQVESSKNEKYYIDFLNKEKGFRQDRA